jgi:hypothetical protein
MTSKTIEEQPEQHRGLQFPWKLHLLLESVEKGGQSHIISWLPDGNSFRVHDKQMFTQEIMQTFFGTSKYKSFQRSLNLWGFQTAKKGPDKGSISNSFFKRGLPDLCQGMERIKIKGTGLKRLSSPVAFGATPSAFFRHLPSSLSIGIQAAPAAPPQSKHQVSLEDFMRIPSGAERFQQHYASNPYLPSYNGRNTGHFHHGAESASPAAGIDTLALADDVVQLIAAARTANFVQGMLQSFAQQESRH